MNHPIVQQLYYLTGIGEASSDQRSELQVSMYVTSRLSFNVSIRPRKYFTLLVLLHFLKKRIFKCIFKGSLFKVSISSKFDLKQLYYLLQQECMKRIRVLLPFFRLSLSSKCPDIQAEEMFHLISSSLTSLILFLPFPKLGFLCQHRLL